MSIKSTFSIKDLENLSGIKAHTIRIWEKRYNLLEPKRSDTNIRAYNTQNLQKILNISLLNQQGLKISKIADLSEEQINEKVREYISQNESSEHAVNDFKMAMINFDQEQFDNTYNQLLAQYSFRDIFFKVVIKFLEDIGNLWTSNTITPAHEHFIFSLIKQKLLINIERVQTPTKVNGKTFVLFLPINEIHDLGLLYIHFELLLKGYRSIYLGPNVPVDNLLELQKIFEETEFVSYFTIYPQADDCEAYISDLLKHVLTERNEKVHILGRNTNQLDKLRFPDNINIYGSIKEIIGNF